MSKQPVNLTLQGCFELFIDRCERENLSTATIQFYLYNIGSFIRYLAAEHNLENPSVVDFKAENIHKYLKKAKERYKWEGHSKQKRWVASLSALIQGHYGLSETGFFQKA